MIGTSMPQPSKSRPWIGSRTRHPVSVVVETTWYFDVVLTALILVGGADRVAELLKVPGARGGDKPVERPVQVTGTLVLEDGAAKRAVTPGS